MPNVFHRKEKEEKYNPCWNGHDYYEVSRSTRTRKPRPGDIEAGGDGFEHRD